MWEWIASTLEADHATSRLPGEQAFISANGENWKFGPAGGDLTRRETIEYLWKQGRAQCNLVTADGGLDTESQPELQEARTAPLIVAEFLTALGLLRKNGTLLLKMFTFALPISQQVLRWASALFQRVVIVKPTASKHTNSEVYLECFALKDELPDSQLNEWLCTYVKEGTLPDVVIEPGFDTMLLRLQTEIADRQMAAIRWTCSQRARLVKMYKSPKKQEDETQRLRACAAYIESVLLI
jgi:hypothetical protein